MPNRATGLLGAALRRMLAGGRPRLPDGADPLLRIFLALHETREIVDGAPQPIAFYEIEAYARLMRWPLAPRHVETIRALDRQWLGRDKGGQRPSAGKITPAAFDAVFG